MPGSPYGSPLSAGTARATTLRGADHRISCIAAGRCPDHGEFVAGPVKVTLQARETIIKGLKPLDPVGNLGAPLGDEVW